MQAVLILGAGPLALATARALCAQGQSVVLASRSAAPLPPALVAAGAQTLRLDVHDASALALAVGQTSAVVHCVQPPYERWAQEFPALTHAIAQAALRAGKPLVMGDNLYMYGRPQGPLTEDSPSAAHTRKGRVRAAMAAQLLAMAGQGLQVALVRGSDFFGPGVRASALGERVFMPALTGKTLSFMGRLDQPHSFTYIEDFGRALAAVALRPDQVDLWARAWHVPNAPALTQQAVAELLGQLLGRKLRAAGMGRWMLSLAGLFIAPARESVEMLYEFEAPFMCDGTALRQRLGLEPTPSVQALEHTLAWYRREQNINA